jgi:glycosyltransferase involved in cell wall biosynthesis
MNVLVVHNFYQQPGGEDAVFNDEVRLLQSRGHEVQTYTVHNDAVAQLGKLALARKTLWNKDSYRAIYDTARQMRADVVHFHNTLPLVSPAGYKAARDAGAGVVQTLHNYRLSCPAATFFRDGQVCEKCLGRTFALPAIRHKCYRGSTSASAVVAAMLARHRLRGTYVRDVDVYIALTEFARRKMIAAGLPENRIVVKPNFVDPDPGAGEGEGAYVLSIGRLSPEKGIETLLRAWEHSPDLPPLWIAGDGPLRDAVQAAVKSNGKIRYLGRVPGAQVLQLLSSAMALVFPSLWYEGQPRTIIEAFAKGTPVVASRLGSMEELIEPGRSGVLFAPGDAQQLAQAVVALARDPALGAMRRTVRETYQRLYTADSNYQRLLAIYQRVSSAARGAADKPDNVMPAGMTHASPSYVTDGTSRT